MSYGYRISSIVCIYLLLEVGAILCMYSDLYLTSTMSGTADSVYTRQELIAISVNINKEVNLSGEVYSAIKSCNIALKAPTRRGKRAGKRTHKPDSKQINSVKVRKTSELIKLGIVNCRSVRYKANIVNNYVVENDIDILAMTETWLKSEKDEPVILGNLCPNGYTLSSKPRVSKTSKRGGGLGTICRSNLSFKKVASKQNTTFEHMVHILQSPFKTVRVIIVYRPPPSKFNKFTHKQFYG